jgi:hypothetical protein
MLLCLLEDITDFFKNRVITARAVSLVASIYSLRGQLKEYNQELEQSLKYKPRRKKKK